ncbi:MarR family winged helix-turn-helix transcriptional regulator [Streptomyces sp. NPDC002990]
MGPVPPSQLRALTVIEERAGINLRDLGEALGSAPPAVSRLCDRLEAAGLLQRSRGSTNRREVELSLSRRGSAVLADIRALRTQKIAEVLQEMSPQHRRSLAEGLTAFHDAAVAHVGLDLAPGAGNGLSDTA